MANAGKPMRWKRMTIVAGAIVLAVAALVGGAVYELFEIYEETPPKPDYPKPRSLAEAQRDDLDYLRNLPRLDWSFSDQSRRQANAVIDAALRKSFPLAPGA